MKTTSNTPSATRNAVPKEYDRAKSPFVSGTRLFILASPQTVYLWVERKQIPQLRMMGRNIRFLKSDLEPFRAPFKPELENRQDQ